MSAYILGMLTCGYYLMFSHPTKKRTTLREQAAELAFVLIGALVWPFTLGVWMARVKNLLEKRNL